MSFVTLPCTPAGEEGGLEQKAASVFMVIYVCRFGATREGSSASW